MRSPHDRIVVGLYICLIGWFGVIGGWLLASPLVLYPSFGVVVWGSVLNWFGVRAERRRRRDRGGKSR